MVYAEVKQLSPLLYGIADFGGHKIEIPGAEQDDNLYFTLDQPEEIRKYYAENDYVVVRSLLPQVLRERANALFAAANLSRATSIGRRAAIPRGYWPLRE